MPLLLITRPFPDTTFGLWQIAEQEAFFQQELPLTLSEKAELAEHQNPLRRLEWLAARWLLHKLSDSPQRLRLAKDAFSKPFFPEDQHLSCSLSHSKGHVGALLVGKWDNSPQPHSPQPDLPMAPQGGGCDIQVVTPKMWRIAHKFLNKAEQSFVDGQPSTTQLDLLHIFWTAKESLYKVYGLKRLDFRQHIFVEINTWDGQSGRGLGRVQKDTYRQDCELVFQKTSLPEEGELIWAVAYFGKRI